MPPPATSSTCEISPGNPPGPGAGGYSGAAANAGVIATPARGDAGAGERKPPLARGRVRLDAGCSRARSRGRTCWSGPGATAADLQLGGDRLDLGVGMERLVAHLAAPARLLVPAERQCRVEHVVAVDPDGAGPELLRQGMGLGDVPGPDARPQAVLGVVRDRGDLIQVGER